MRMQVCHHHQLLDQSEEHQRTGPDDIMTPLPTIHRRNCDWKESLVNQNGNGHEPPAAWHSDDLWKNPSDSLSSDQMIHPTLPAARSSDFDVDNCSRSLPAPDVCVRTEAPPQRRVLQQPPVSRVRLRFALNKERKVTLPPHQTSHFNFVFIKLITNCQPRLASTK